MKKFKIRIIAALLVVGIIGGVGIFYYNTKFASIKKDKLDCNHIISLNSLKDTQLNISTTESGIISLLGNYYDIKNDFRDANLLKEYTYEYNVINELASKDTDCSSILQFDKTDEYSYQLCKLYKAKDIAGLKTFKFDPKDADMLPTFQSLLEGKYIEGAKKTIYDTVSQYDTLKTNVQFDLKNSPDALLMPYYIYLKNNSEGAFIQKLDNAFLKECKDINKQ